MITANNNLGNILFSKARQAILSLLYSHVDEAFYLRQIVRTTGIGLGPVQRELKNLTDAGIITREVQGRQVYYRANPKCPIFDDLKGIVRKTFGIADVIRQALEPIADKIRVAFIFGSIASGTEQRTSDIDVMVIGRATFDEVVSAMSQAEEKIHREINSVVYPVAEFKRKITSNHHFLKTVLEGEKIFLIGDDSDLTRLVK